MSTSDVPATASVTPAIPHVPAVPATPVPAVPAMLYACAECLEPLEVTGPPCIDAAALARSLDYHAQTTGHHGILRRRLGASGPLPPLPPLAHVPRGDPA